MSEASRDAKLKLKLDSADAVRGMADVQRAGEKIEQQQSRIAEAAKKANSEMSRGASGSAANVIERFGANDLSKSEMRKARAAEKKYASFVDNFHNEQAVLETEARKKQAAQVHQAQNERLKAGIKSKTDAANAPSSLMALAGPIGIATAAVFTFARVLGTAATVQANLANAEMTEAQKYEIRSNDLTFGLTKTLRNFADAIDGTTERIRVAAVRLERQTALNAADAQQRQQFNSSFVPAQQGTNRFLALSSATSTRLDTSMDRSTLTGERAYHEEQQRFGARSSANESAREADVARRNAESARENTAIAQARADEATQGTDQAMATQHGSVAAENRSRVRRRAPRAEAGTEATLALQREQAATDQLREAKQREGQAGVAAAEAESRARQASINLMQTELQILQQREQRMVSAAERMGAMSSLDRQLGVSAVRQIQQVGIENVHADVRARASQVAPDWFRQQTRNFGQNTPELAQLQQLGAEDRGSIGDTRGEMNRLQQSITDETLRSQRQLSEDVAKVLSETLMAIMAQFQREVEIVKRRFETAQQMRNNQTPG